MNLYRIRRTLLHACSASLLLVFLLSACGGSADLPTRSQAESTQSAGDLSVSITGGYDLDPRDSGRPVVLIAAALGVPSEVFREAFSHVQPAGAGQEPGSAQVQRNKAALLSVLGPYGIINEALDRVSDYYRYNGSAGETWPRTPATATAIVTNGVVTGFTITQAGAGYTSTPSITIVGHPEVRATATISYGTDLNTNGSLTAITLVSK
jgi:hypothetical protein